MTQRCVLYIAVSEMYSSVWPPEDGGEDYLIAVN